MRSATFAAAMTQWRRLAGKRKAVAAGPLEDQEVMEAMQVHLHVEDFRRTAAMRFAASAAVAPGCVLGGGGRHRRVDERSPSSLHGIPRQR